MKLINDNKIRIFTAFDCDEKYILDKASEFELFSLWESMLYLARDTEEACLYEKMLSARSLFFPEYPRSSEDEFSRWRKLYEDYVYGDEPTNAKNEYTAEAFPAPKREISDAVDLFEWVSKNIIKCHSFSELSELFVNEAVKDNKAYISLEIDEYDVLDQRPNLYLAGKAFDEFKCGEFYNSTKIVLATELLISLYASAKAREGIFVLLGGKSALSMAEDILPYLERRALFYGRVLLKINNEDDARRFIKLLDLSLGKIRVYPFLLDGEEAPEYLTKKYPQKAMYRYFKKYL